MFNKIFDRIPPTAWKIAALILIVVLMRGNIIAGYELMAMMDMLGADFFVLVYLSGLLLYLQPVLLRLNTITQDSFPAFSLLPPSEQVYYLGCSGLKVIYDGIGWIFMSIVLVIVVQVLIADVLPLL